MAINNKTNMFSIYLQLAYCSLLAINMGESLKLTRKWKWPGWNFQIN